MPGPRLGPFSNHRAWGYRAAARIQWRWPIWTSTVRTLFSKSSRRMILWSYYLLVTIPVTDTGRASSWLPRFHEPQKLIFGCVDEPFAFLCLTAERIAVHVGKLKACRLRIVHNGWGFVSRADNECVPYFHGLTHSQPSGESGSCGSIAISSAATPARRTLRILIVSRCA
jgi:hypothetical protein